MCARNPANHTGQTALALPKRAALEHRHTAGAASQLSSSTRWREKDEGWVQARITWPGAELCQAPPEPSGRGERLRPAARASRRRGGGGRPAAEGRGPRLRPSRTPPEQGGTYSPYLRREKRGGRAERVKPLPITAPRPLGTPPRSPHNRSPWGGRKGRDSAPRYPPATAAGGGVKGIAPHFSLLLTMTPPPSEWFLFSAMAAAAAASSQRRARSAPARERGAGRCGGSGT